MGKSIPEGYAKIDSTDEYLGAILKKDGTRAEQDKLIVDVLTQFGVIDPAEIRICSCGANMKFQPTTRTDGFTWRCVKSKCSKFSGLRENTIFAKHKLCIWQQLAVMFNWSAEGLGTRAARLAHITEHTVGNLKKEIRSIVLQQYNKNDRRIGGEGKIVEIDESLFVHVKHNRGHGLTRSELQLLSLCPIIPEL